MAREIGSEFWDVQPVGKTNHLFPESTQWFLSGRSALQAILRRIGNARSAALPSWCCDSIVRPFIDLGIEVLFYPVYFRDDLIQEICLECDVLFLMDFFGYNASERRLSDYKGMVIRDTTHSLFSFSYTDADFFFGSLRKWCGVRTGGYAWARDNSGFSMEESDGCCYEMLREKAMQMKSNYIHGRGVTDKGYLKVFEDAEACLEEIGIAPAADSDVRQARRIDVEGMKTRRRANAEVLSQAFPEWLIFPEMKPSDCPMFVPILVPDGKRDELRRYLISHEIYCPIHWPVSKYHRLNEKTGRLYENELSLVCDQRYTEADMERIVETIRQFWKVD